MATDDLAADQSAATDSPVGRTRWHHLVAQALAKSGTGVSAQEVESALGTPTDDGYTLRPLYTPDDMVGIPVDDVPGTPDFARGRTSRAGWQVWTRLAGSPQEIAAQLALDHSGVDGFYVSCPDANRREFADLVASLLEQQRAVQFDWSLPANQVELLAAQLAKTPLPAGTGLGQDPIGASAATGRSGDVDAADALAPAARELGISAYTIDASVYHEAGASFAEEIGAASAAGVSTMRRLIADGMTPTQAAACIDFRFVVTDDQFASIAKLRAARVVWNRVLEIAAADAVGQRQHAVTSWSMLTQRDPWVNLMRNTVAAFAAGVGGAQSVTVLPHTSALTLPDELAFRLARNTQHLLLAESHTDVVADPVGGSWYVEHRTEDIAEAAWQWLTELEGSGGIRRAIESGLLAQRVARTWQIRRDRIAHIQDELTGINSFPDRERNPEDDGSISPAAEPYVRPGGKLPQHRWAEDFENLRDRADLLASQGPAATVGLLTLGPLAAHAARLTFAENYFAAGGLAAEVSSDPAELQHLPVVCLCGSDQSYADELAGIDLPTQEVMIAGPDRDGYFGLRDKNAVTVLSNILDRWESK